MFALREVALQLVRRCLAVDMGPHTGSCLPPACYTRCLCFRSENTARQWESRDYALRGPASSLVGP